MTIPTPMAKAAAAWWRKAVERPKFDNGDSSAQGGLAAGLATLNSRKRAPTPEQLDTFEARLAWVLEHDFTDWILSVDYGPDPTLAETAVVAGIADDRFPWKTTMWVDRERGTLRVRHGYGAPIETIYPPQET